MLRGVFYTADEHQTTSLRSPTWKIVLWTISALAALVALVLVAALIRSYTLNIAIVLVTVITRTPPVEAHRPVVRPTYLQFPIQVCFLCSDHFQPATPT